MVNRFLTNMPMQIQQWKEFNKIMLKQLFCIKRTDLRSLPETIHNNQLKTFDRPMYKSSDGNTYKRKYRTCLWSYWQKVS